MDILIIGGGICGVSVARELSRYCDANITVVEKGNDVSVGTTKANSGVIHAGFDAKPQSLKAKFNVLGNAMFDQLSKDLDFPFVRNGSLVLCFDKDKLTDLYKLFEKGIENKVKGISIIDGDHARQLEPHISEQVVGALYAPSGGIVSPYEMAIAYAENAFINGVKFKFETQVTNITKKGKAFSISTSNGETLTADVIINCAGVHADDINNMVCSEKITITPRKGDYVLMDKDCSYLCSRTLFQLPSDLGKGVLVTPSTHGNILVGPTATDTDDKENVATQISELNALFIKGQLSVPELSKRTIITQFSGLRASCSTGDFIIGLSSVKGFYNIAGIESPGLTCAPAIAVEISNQIASSYKLELKNNFISKRKGIVHFSKLDNTQRRQLIAENPLYGHIVCRCEMVTEGEIVDSINRPLGAVDLDGIKRRTRAGMGRCQMGFCSPRIIEILSEQKKLQITSVTKCGGNSSIVTSIKE